MDFNEVFKQQMKDLLAEEQLSNGVPVTPQQQGPKPLKLTIGGQEMTFASEVELASQLEKTLNAEAVKSAALEARVAALTPAPAAPPPDDKAKKALAFMELLEKDPDAFFQQGFAAATGIPNAHNVLRQTAVDAESNRQLLEIARFRDQNPTFDPTKHGPALDQIRQNAGLGITASNLDMAWSQGLKNGWIKADPVQNQQQTPWGAPNTGGNMTSNLAPQFDPALVNQFETLSSEKQEQFLRQNGYFASE